MRLNQAPLVFFLLTLLTIGFRAMYTNINLSNEIAANCGSQP